MELDSIPRVNLKRRKSPAKQSDPRTDESTTNQAYETDTEIDTLSFDNSFTESESDTYTPGSIEYSDEIGIESLEDGLWVNDKEKDPLFEPI